MSEDDSDSTPPTEHTPHPQSADRLYVNSRRECLILLFAFAFFLIWSVGTCYTMGYDVPASEVGATVFGMPRWTFWGIAVPWLAADVFTVYFCMIVMKDDPLDDQEPINGDES